MTTDDVLLMFLRNALWGKSLPAGDIPHQNVSMLLKRSDEQTVTGLVCSALMNPKNDFSINRHDTSIIYANHWDIQERNKKVNTELTALCQLLNKHSIRYVVVKGQTIAAHYPNPLDRVPGDIDFYILPADFERAYQLIQEDFLLAETQNGEFLIQEDRLSNKRRPSLQQGEERDEAKTESPEQHVAFTRNGIYFEMHFCLLKFASPRNQRYFDTLINESVLSPSTCIIANGTEVPVFPPTLNLLYTFLHLYHHLLELGCGLRQFIDLAVLIDKQDINYQELRKNLHALDFELAFETILYILHNTLGLPNDNVTFSHSYRLQEQKLLAPQLLHIVLTHGNFGFYHQKYAIRSGWRYYLDTTKRKLRHYRLFYRLSPREIRCSLLYSIPRKIKDALQRETRNISLFR